MPTQLIRGLYNLKERQQGNCITIGNFDGVHLGHQLLIKKMLEKAKTLKVPSLIVTFEPHPFEFFSREHLTVPRITRLREKFLALAATGVDNVLILPFNQKLANISASDFVSKILCDKLKIKHVVIGDDFRFGHERRGDITYLKEKSAHGGFTVESMPSVLKDSERVSSTLVRNALMQGDIAKANRLLGRSYQMLGRVRLGDRRGRQLGFPTANIYLHRKLTPLKGVYTVFMHGIADHPIPGVANIGVRPTVDGTKSLLEVHLLNFNQDIYGVDVAVEFCEKLRDEVKFETLDLLKQQIQQDIEKAQHYFQKQGVL